MTILLPFLFLAVSWLYAMAGFGGGSTYIALLAISGLPLASIPVIALVCNLVVSGQGSAILIRRGHAPGGILAPLLGGSIPAAFLGGAWRLPEATFVFVLALALTLAGASMLLQNFARRGGSEAVSAPPRWVLFLGGAILGLLAGVTGIGGGIYLAPVMHLLRWARPQSIAACTSLFIALNSLAGLVGQLTKGPNFLDALPPLVLIACPVAVLIGGGIGTRLLSTKLSRERIRTITAAVVLLVAARLWMGIATGANACNAANFDSGRIHAGLVGSGGRTVDLQEKRIAGQQWMRFSGSGSMIRASSTLA